MKLDRIKCPKCGFHECVTPKGKLRQHVRGWRQPTCEGSGLDVTALIAARERERVIREAGAVVRDAESKVARAQATLSQAQAHLDAARAALAEAEKSAEVATG